MPSRKRSRSEEMVASPQDKENGNGQNVEPAKTSKPKKRAKASRKSAPETNKNNLPKVVNVAYGEVNKNGEKVPMTDLERHRKGKEDFTAIAWNVGSLRSLLNHKVHELVDLCKKEQPDVIGFMEIKLSNEDMCEECDNLLREAVEDILGPVEIVWNHCTAKKGYSGTAFVVRKSAGKFESKLGIDGHDDPEGRTITLEFDDMVAVLCYVPNSGQDLNRLGYRTAGKDCFDAELAKYCESFDKATLLLGDLNVADRDVDIWNVDKPHIPKSAGTTNEERESFREHYTSKGFIDTFADMHPEATGCFSYWSVRARNKPKNRGLRLDYVMAAPGFPADKIKDAFILEDFAPHGDHCPVGVTFKRSKKHPLKRL
ncbi:DNA-(apurinic or apyrimidinic site) lyase [Perkinsus olseni]|uniref:DNA-(apurinic or apyrimidinic site) endonuclease n=1 Tax=Perkinsus olseni TaxID=32597 RepID=A0A7J6MD21_PEROL|nr:DNA-(apurinic or apyrimidinic site) lyase [Perkinsus olseni]KAF4674684.1 DNA-(apurinic or apyrimidinic site) lyase [Perkinsus olseni]